MTQKSPLKLKKSNVAMSPRFRLRVPFAQTTVIREEESEDLDSEDKSFRSMLEEGRNRRFFGSSGADIAVLKQVRRKMFDKLEERFHEDEKDRMRVIQNEKKVFHMLEMNKVRLKRQGKRHGQKEAFSLAESGSSGIDLQNPNTITATRIKGDKKYKEIVSSKFNEIINEMDQEAIRTVAIVKQERLEMRQLGKRDWTSVERPKVRRPVNKAALRIFKQQHKAKTRETLRRALVRFAMLGMKEEDLGREVVCNTKLIFTCRRAEDMFGNVRHGRAKLVREMLEADRWLVFERDRVELDDGRYTRRCTTTRRRGTRMR